MSCLQRLAALLSTSSHLCYVDFEAAVKEMGPRIKKARRSKSLFDAKSERGSNVRVIPLSQICLGCMFTTPSSVTLIEKEWGSIQEHFPSPVYRHRYGS